MRILIVDAFSSGPQGRVALRDFKNLIRKAFEAPFKTWTGELLCAVRDKQKLQEFLNDPNTEFSQPSALRSFCALDMIFIGSDDNSIIPWAKSVRQVAILMKQCIRFHKPLFATSFAMQMLTSICLLEGEDVKIMNGRGRGGPLLENYGAEEEASLPKMLKNLSNYDVELAGDEYFLDAGTGNLFGQIKKEWYFSGKNVGIFNPMFAKKMCTQTHGGYKDKDRRWEELKPVRVDEHYAELANPRYLQHWLLRGLPKQFILSNRCQWNVTWDMPPYFEMLLAGKTPILITFGPICGLQSAISRKYPETIRILDNWINYVTRRIMNNDLDSLGYCVDILGVPRTMPSGFNVTARTNLEDDDRQHSKESRYNEIQDTSHLNPIAQNDIMASTLPSRGGERLEGTSMDDRPHSQGQYPATWEQIERAFSQPAQGRAPYRNFTKHEIRTMLHPSMNIEDDTVEVKRVEVFPVTSRSAVSTRSREGTIPPLREKNEKSKTLDSKPPPFIYPGKLTCGNQFPETVPNYVTRTPGTFPADHSFRDTEKGKWTHPRGFQPSSGGWNLLPIAFDAAAKETLNQIPFRYRDHIKVNRNVRRPKTVPVKIDVPVY